jgi:predicted GH43/DUF377 family glycosyl hydrolase
MRLIAVFTALLLVGGCGKYEDFSLPAPGGATEYELDWQVRPEPVIARGNAVDVLNPSVVPWGGGWMNLYSRFDGSTWETWQAESADGLVWLNPRKILAPELDWEGNYIAANGGLVELGGKLYYAYQAGPKGQNEIGMAISSDGKAWSKHPAPVLSRGPWMSWDEQSVGDPYLWVVDDWLWMAYLGEDRAGRQRLGLARSKDGFRWTKLRANPVLELGGAGDFDEVGLGEPAVFPMKGQWVMLYTGRDRKETRRMGYAVSKDGVNWQKLAEPVLAGSEDWMRAVVCDASVWAEPSRVRIWFGGGDQAKPDERLNGQIGYAELRKK